MRSVTREFFMAAAAIAVLWISFGCGGDNAQRSYYAVSLTAEPPEGGNPTGGGTFEAGTEIIVSAGTGDGYDFTGWFEDSALVSGLQEYSFVVSGDVDLIAKYTPIVSTHKVTLQAEPPEGGNPTGGGTFEAGTEIIVSAGTGDGYDFTGWFQGVDEMSPHETFLFTVERDTILTARFIQDSEPAGALFASPNPCNIFFGATTCSTTVSWQTNNAPNAGLRRREPEEIVLASPAGSTVMADVTETGYTLALHLDATDPNSEVLDTLDLYGVVESPPDPIDIRDYFVEGNNVYRKHDEYVATRRNLFFAHPDEDHFWPIYSTWLSLEKPGRLLVFQKVYRSHSEQSVDAADLDCTATYGLLFLGEGEDKSVIEVGGWHNDGFRDPNRVDGECLHRYGLLGYQDTSDCVFPCCPHDPDETCDPPRQLPGTGLNWSLSSGLGHIAHPIQFDYIFRRRPNGDPENPQPYKFYGSLAYSTTQLTGFFPTWSPQYGRNTETGEWGTDHGNEYHDVIRLILFHGTRMTRSAGGGDSSETEPCRTDSDNPYSKYYHHEEGYYSYASEFYMSRCRGILQHRQLYREMRANEDEGEVRCNRNMPSWSEPDNLERSLNIWTNYID